MNEETKMLEIKPSPLGDPAAIGTAGFATTTLLLGLINAGIVSGEELGIVVVLAFFYGGLAQVLAGMWEIKKNNTLGAAIFTSFGMFWIALATLVIYFLHKTVPFGPLNQVLGIYLAIWFLPALIFWIASFKTNWILMLALLFVVVAVIAGVFANLGGSAALGIINGWSLIIAALLAYWLCAASCVNSTFGRTVLPVFPMK